MVQQTEHASQIPSFVNSAVTLLLHEAKTSNVQKSHTLNLGNMLEHKSVEVWGFFFFFFF